MLVRWALGYVLTVLAVSLFALAGWQQLSLIASQERIAELEGLVKTNEAALGASGAKCTAAERQAAIEAQRAQQLESGLDEERKKSAQLIERASLAEEDAEKAKSSLAAETAAHEATRRTAAEASLKLDELTRAAGAVPSQKVDVCAATTPAKAPPPETAALPQPAPAAANTQPTTPGATAAGAPAASTGNAAASPTAAPSGDSSAAKKTPTKKLAKRKPPPKPAQSFGGFFD